MAAPVPPPKQKRYLKLRQEGWNRAAACREVGVSYHWAIRFDKGHDNSGAGYLMARSEAKLAGPVPFDNLSEEAWRALADFEFFRLRYFGHVSTPWQIETAEIVLELLETDDREYVVENMAPGVGKSTLLVDIAAWLICRDRAVRILFISRSQSLADRNVKRLRRALERTSPAKAKPQHVAWGIAFDAQATLAGDFGRFKPEQAGDVWRGNEFVVEQHDGSLIEEKEPTASAFGFDSEWIGNRFDVLFGDDLDTSRSTKNPDVVAQNRETFDNELEPRLEPGGLMVVAQQRLGPFDFSAHCLAKQVVPDDDGSGEDLEGTPQYRHIRYRAHDETKCRGQETHRPAAPPWPDGCLLDPRRLSWRDLRKKQGNRQRYAVVYQQDEVDPEDVLVQEVWITGGRGLDGVDYVGCEDHDRALCDIPPDAQGPVFSIATADPSPTKYWSVQWWLYSPVTELRWLVDHERRTMDGPDFFDYNPLTASYSGLVHEWQTRSDDLGRPITYWVVEANVAQRWLLRYIWARQYFTKHNVLLIPHETQRNKADEKLGVQQIATHYKHGRVRLPRKPGPGRLASQRLIDEVTHHPNWPTDDCVMAHWFLEWNLPNIAYPTTPPTGEWRPSWMAA